MRWPTWKVTGMPSTPRNTLPLYGLSEPSPLKTCTHMLFTTQFTDTFLRIMSKHSPPSGAPCLSRARTVLASEVGEAGEGAHCSCKPGSILIVDEVHGIASPPGDLPHAQEEGVGPPLQHRMCLIACVTPTVHTF